MARNPGLMFRMENADSAAAGTDADASLEVNSAATQAAQEVEGASGDVTEVDTGIENAETAQTELGDVQGLVEEAVEDGDGLSPREAAHVEARLEHIANLLGTTIEAQGLTFRRESFGGAQSRLAATKMRLEGIKAMATSIWEAMKRGWVWLKEAVSNLFAKITSNAEAVEKRLKDLKGRADGLTDTAKPKNDKLKASAKAFSVGGTTSKETVGKVIDDVTAATAIISGITSATNPSQIAGQDVSDVGAKLTGIIKGALKTSITSLPKGSPEGSTGYGNLLGGTTMIVTPDKKSVGGSELALISVSIGAASDKTAEDYPAFRKKDLQALAAQGIALAGTVKDLNKIKKELETMTAANIKFCEERSRLTNQVASKDVEGKDGKNALVDDNQRTAAALGNFSSVSRVVATKIPSMLFSTLVAVADMVDAGVSNLKAEEKKKD